MQLKKLLRIPLQAATVKTNPYVEHAREYWFKIAELMPFVLSACINNPDSAAFLADLFVKDYHMLTDMIDQDFGYCKNCNSIYYQSKLCSKKDFKQTCELKTKAPSDERIALIDLPDPPSRKPITLDDIDTWRNYLDQLEEILKP
ncbi:hypothetical protein UFOVP724_100 [uncultured Caudovirales phage]|uniref:Uncharacterized protein n=1 Tax=uncultured Caudovirales phage TaxID=2100421 RepID=A0A6J5NR84_9CAUD|nr:hypothetical protein UFOVP724_100 [uncultured Caudovirales phage]